jgi:hypothetical protein
MLKIIGFIEFDMEVESFWGNLAHVCLVWHQTKVVHSILPTHIFVMPIGISLVVQYKLSHNIILHCKISCSCMKLEANIINYEDPIIILFSEQKSLV